MTASRTPAVSHAVTARRDVLPTSTRALCAFAAAMTAGRTDAALDALNAARNARTPRREAEETALMLCLYAGYPSALESLRLLNATWPGRARRTREGTSAHWRARGAKLCRRVYGPAYARLLPAVRSLHPDLAVWMEEHGYGRVLARAGLSVRERELVTVSALASLGWERQLVSHVLGALRVGATPAHVREALAIGARQANANARTVAERTWERAVRAGMAASGERKPRTRGARERTQAVPRTRRIQR